MTVLDNARRMASVRYGMRVLDSAGAPVGFVCAVRRADPLAVDASGGRIGQATDLVSLLPHIQAKEPRVTSLHAATRLVRSGFIKIDGRDVDHVDRYAVADQIARVDDDTVHLAVPRHSLVVRR